MVNNPGSHLPNSPAASTMQANVQHSTDLLERVQLLLTEAKSGSPKATKAREELFNLLEKSTRKPGLCQECISDRNIAIMLIVNSYLNDDKSATALINKVQKTNASIIRRYCKEKNENIEEELLEEKWHADLTRVLFSQPCDPVDRMAWIESSVICQEALAGAMITIGPRTTEVLKTLVENPLTFHEKYVISEKRLEKIILCVRTKIIQNASEMLLQD